jgi:hypothetical protein
MTHNCTPNDLIRFIYRETTQEEDSNIKEWLMENTQASDLFRQLLDSIDLLKTDFLEPSETSINIILDFSKENAHEESHV